MIKSNKSNFVRLLKLVTLILCVVCFVFNVLGSTLNFLNSATVQQSSTQNDKTELPLPAFVICNGIGFQRSTSVPWEEAVYLNTTRDPDEFEILVVEPTAQVPIPMAASNYTLKVWNTAYHGRCVSVEFKHMVL